MNELTELGDLNTALARRWGAQGRLVHTMASDLFPVVAVDGSKDPDLFFLAGERLCGTQQQVAAAGVGQNGIITLQNPTGSGVVMTLLGANAQAEADTYLQWMMILEGDPDNATLTGNAPVRGELTDARWGFGNRAAGVLATWATAGITLGARVARTVALANTMQRFSNPVVLTPGSQFYVLNENANQLMSGAFFWSERRLTAWERRAGV